MLRGFIGYVRSHHIGLLALVGAMGGPAIGANR